MAHTQLEKGTVPVCVFAGGSRDGCNLEIPIMKSASEMTHRPTVKVELLEALKVVAEMKGDKAMANRNSVFLQQVAQELVGREVEFVRGVVQRVRAKILSCGRGSWSVRMLNLTTLHEYDVNITAVRIDYVSAKEEQDIGTRSNRVGSFSAETSLSF